MDLSSLRSAAIKEYFNQPVVDTFDISICPVTEPCVHNVDFRTVSESGLANIDIPLIFHINQCSTVRFNAFFTKNRQSGLQLLLIHIWYYYLFRYMVWPFGLTLVSWALRRTFGCRLLQQSLLPTGIRYADSVFYSDLISILVAMLFQDKSFVSAVMFSLIFSLGSLLIGNRLVRARRSSIDWPRQNGSQHAAIIRC